MIMILIKMGSTILDYPLWPHMTHLLAKRNTKACRLIVFSIKAFHLSSIICSTVLLLFRSFAVVFSENSRQKKVVDAFLHAWTAYKKYAWGFDELKPLSKSGNNWLNVGLTIVDSLDTMIIMKLKEGQLDCHHCITLL